VLNDFVQDNDAPHETTREERFAAFRARLDALEGDSQEGVVLAIAGDDVFFLLGGHPLPGTLVTLLGNVSGLMGYVVGQLLDAMPEGLRLVAENLLIQTHTRLMSELRQKDANHTGISMTVAPSDEPDDPKDTED